MITHGLIVIKPSPDSTSDSNIHIQLGAPRAQRRRAEDYDGVTRRPRLLLQNLEELLLRL